MSKYLDFEFETVRDVHGGVLPKASDSVRVITKEACERGNLFFQFLCTFCATNVAPPFVTLDTGYFSSTKELNSLQSVRSVKQQSLKL